MASRRFSSMTRAASRRFNSAWSLAVLWPLNPVRRVVRLFFLAVTEDLFRDLRVTFLALALDLVFFLVPFDLDIFFLDFDLAFFFELALARDLVIVFFVLDFFAMNWSAFLSNSNYSQARIVLDNGEDAKEREIEIVWTKSE